MLPKILYRLYKIQNRKNIYTMSYETWYKAVFVLMYKNAEVYKGTWLYRPLARYHEKLTRT